MKKVKFLSLLAASVVAASAAVSEAQPPIPMPDPVASPSVVMAAPVVMAGPVDLYPCVEYKHLRDMSCCAKPMIVEARDPCWRPDPCSPCCKPPCVKVKICVPDQCCPPTVKCHRDGKSTRYDFGKYAVTVVTKRDHIEVTYHD